MTILLYLECVKLTTNVTPFAYQTGRGGGRIRRDENSLTT